MTGRDNALYQEMLGDIGALTVAADELGYDAIAFTEHHFHIEGFEISNNPVLLDTFVAMQAKRIRVGRLAEVSGQPANRRTGSGALGTGHWALGTGHWALKSYTLPCKLRGWPAVNPGLPNASPHCGPSWG